MYNNVYQDYIDNIMGTTVINRRNFENNTYIDQMSNQNNITTQLERFYPELYKLLYPMIKTACMKNTKPLTEENINEMVKEIYSNFVAEDVTVLNINLTNDVKSSSKERELQNDRSSVNKSNSTNKAVSKDFAETRNSEKNEERNFRPNNYILSDLIRILLIRELIGTQGNFAQNRTGFLENPFYRQNEMNFGSQDYSIYEKPINTYYNFDNGYNIF